MLCALSVSKHCVCCTQVQCRIGLLLSSLQSALEKEVSGMAKRKHQITFLVSQVSVCLCGTVFHFYACMYVLGTEIMSSNSRQCVPLEALPSLSLEYGPIRTPMVGAFVCTACTVLRRVSSLYVFCILKVNTCNSAWL